MPQLVCIDEGVHAGRLTRGRLYEVAAEDEARGLVRVRGDNGRLRWYPRGQFAGPDVVPTHLVSFELDDPITDPADDWVEVTVTLSDGTRRWLTFITPLRLTKGGDVFSLSNGGEVRAHMELGQVVVITAISTETIGAVLAYLDGQNKLVAHSRLLREPLILEEELPPGSLPEGAPQPPSGR